MKVAETYNEKLLASKQDTLGHVMLLTNFIEIFCNKMRERASVHDQSKLETPEVESFANADKLNTIEFGSDAYKEALAELGPALEHHYENNDHHPEHHPNGVEDMDLMQIVEMLLDWYASTHRMKDGDIMKSIEINSERFNMSPQLRSILENTIKRL